jgi:hypothetical protein
LINNRFFKGRFTRLKEIGVFVGYLTLLVGVIYFDWRPFGIFLSVIVEYFVVLVLYSFLYFHRGVSKPIGETSFVNIFVPAMAVGIINTGFAMSLVSTLILRSEYQVEMENLWWSVSAIALTLFVLHGLFIRAKWSSNQLMDKYRSMVYTGIMAFVAMNIGGVLALEVSKNNEDHIVVITMVTMRLIFEVWMNHFQKSK